SAATWPLAAHAQQPMIPVIGRTGRQRTGRTSWLGREGRLWAVAQSGRSTTFQRHKLEGEEIMKHPVLGRLLPLTIVAVAALSEPACAEPPQTCESLTGLKINSVNLLSATAVGSTADLPAHCRVLGYVRPA